MMDPEIRQKGPGACPKCGMALEPVDVAPVTRTEWTSGDPRPSIEERYPALSAYTAKVKAAVEDLVGKRFMLRGDVQSTIDRLVKNGADTHAMKKDAPTN